MLKSLKIQNYRNYDNLELNLNRGTILIGNNAQGKTNILEAVHYLSSTKSFRVTKDFYLINFEKEFTVVEGLFDELDLRFVIEKHFENTRKTIQKKGVKTSARNVLGEFLSVIFSPEDVSFLKDSPSIRRRYLDIVLSMSNKEYLLSLIKYKKILDQRNSLLKRIREGISDPNELLVWDEKLAEEGIILIAERENFILEVNKSISNFYQDLSGKDEKIKITYKRSIEADFLKELEKCKTADIASGTTNLGPHRDDMVFLKNERETALYGSRGELRSMILALKFSEGLFLEEKKEKEVTYLLDDVFSELDKTRRENLFNLIRSKPFIITTTDLDHIGKDLLNIAKIYEVNKGNIILING